MGVHAWANGESIGYYPDRQTWRCNVATPDRCNDEVWTGLWNERRPRGEELLRRDALNGHRVRLGDGAEWLIPVARKLVQQNGETRFYNALPHAMDLDGDGRWTQRRIVDEYVRLWLIAARFWDVYVAAADEENATDRPSMSDEEIYVAATDALTVNYHVSAHEVAMLGLLIDVRAGEILKAVIDVPALHEWSKKKAAAAPT